MLRFIKLFGFTVLTFSILAGCSDKFELDEADAALVEARKAIAAGDSAKAIEFLDISIATKPDTWSYYERAKLRADIGDDAEAKADVEAGLALDEEHAELLWLKKQLKKSKSSRFKGSAGKPPSSSK